MYNYLPRNFVDPSAPTPLASGVFSTLTMLTPSRASTQVATWTWLLSDKIWRLPLCHSKFNLCQFIIFTFANASPLLISPKYQFK